MRPNKLSKQLELERSFSVRKIYSANVDMVHKEGSSGKDIFQTIFSFSNTQFFHRNRPFYPFFDFIDSGGVKKTHTEKYTFWRSNFYCPQKIIS